MYKKENILFFLLLFFIAALYFPRLEVLNIIAIAAMVGYSFFYNSPSQKWIILKQRRHIIFMLLFFGWVGISFFSSANYDESLNFLDRRLPLLYMPLSIGLLQLDDSFRRRVLLGFVYITFIVCLYCLAYTGYQAYLQHTTALLYNDSLTHVIGHQSIYISLLVNISIFILGREIFFTASKIKGWLVLLVIFLFGISYLLASRTMMGWLYLSTLVFIFYYIVRQKKYLEGLTLLMGMIIGIFMVYKFVPKTFNRFKELTYMQFDYKSMGAESHYDMEVNADQWNGANFRLAAWQCGWEIFKANPITGIGLGNKHRELFKKYEEKDFRFAIETNKNVHNNYLDILYSMGIIGFLLFLIAWIIMPVIQAKRHRDYLSILIILTFAIAWITEIYFDRSLGGMLTGFFICFLLTYPNIKA